MSRRAHALGTLRWRQQFEDAIVAPDPVLTLEHRAGGIVQGIPVAVGGTVQRGAVPRPGGEHGDDVDVGLLDRRA